jgi:prophage maintenance system killer protein
MFDFTADELYFLRNNFLFSNDQKYISVIVLIYFIAFNSDSADSLVA